MRQPTVGVALATARTHGVSAPSSAIAARGRETVGLIGAVDRLDYPDSASIRTNSARRRRRGVNEERLHARVHADAARGRARARAVRRRAVLAAPRRVRSRRRRRARAARRSRDRAARSSTSSRRSTATRSSTRSRSSRPPTCASATVHAGRPVARARERAGCAATRTSDGPSSLAGGVDAGVEHAFGGALARPRSTRCGTTARAVGASAAPPTPRGAAQPHAVAARPRDRARRRARTTRRSVARYVTSSAVVEHDVSASPSASALHAIAEADYDAVHDLQTPRDRRPRSRVRTRAMKPSTRASSCSSIVVVLGGACVAGEQRRDRVVAGRLSDAAPAADLLAREAPRARHDVRRVPSGRDDLALRRRQPDPDRGRVPRVPPDRSQPSPTKAATPVAACTGCHPGCAPDRAGRARLPHAAAAQVRSQRARQARRARAATATCASVDLATTRQLPTMASCLDVPHATAPRSATAPTATSRKIGGLDARRRSRTARSCRAHAASATSTAPASRRDHKQQARAGRRDVQRLSRPLRVRRVPPGRRSSRWSSTRRTTCSSHAVEAQARHARLLRVPSRADVLRRLPRALGHRHARRHAVQSQRSVAAVPSAGLGVARARGRTCTRRSRSAASARARRVIARRIAWRVTAPSPARCKRLAASAGLARQRALRALDRGNRRMCLRCHITEDELGCDWSK